MGYASEDWAGKPITGILNTWSDINPCHAHFRTCIHHVKRGVFQAGGFPIELPALLLAENFVRPTTMLYRGHHDGDCRSAWHDAARRIVQMVWEDLTPEIF